MSALSRLEEFLGGKEKMGQVFMLLKSFIVHLLIGSSLSAIDNSSLFNHRYKLLLVVYSMLRTSE